MASPQKEHGFMPLANELLRALIRQDFTGHQWRVLFALALDSFGRNKKESHLSINEIASLTKLRRERVREALQSMVGRKIVLPGGRTENRPTHQNVRRINKDYDQWGGTENRPRTENRPTPRTLSRPTLERGRGINGVDVNTNVKDNVNVKDLNVYVCSELAKAPTSEPAIPDLLKGLALYEANKSLCTNLNRVTSAWREAFPGVDIRLELAKAHAWEMSNPKRKKIDKMRFLHNWLTRAQDRLKGGSDAHPNYPSRGYIGAAPIASKYAAISKNREDA